jgi:hypothetical protein
LDGGQTWIIKKPSSEEHADSLHDKITFYSPIAEAWKNNAIHRQQYKGVLSDFIDEEAATREAALRKDLANLKNSRAEMKPQEIKKDTVKGKFLKRFRESVKKKWKKMGQEEDSLRQD